MEKLIQALKEAIQANGVLQVETSARHVHLSQTDLEQLFGKGHQLTPKRALSQPGQYLSEEKVTVIGPKGEKKVSVLGPVRNRTQVELSRSDCMSLGLSAPIRLSGELEGSGSVILKGPNGAVALSEGAIVAKAHIHMTPEMAQKLRLRDRQRVALEVLTERPVLLKDVIIRVDEASSCKVHIDTDEANAAGCEGFTLGRIVTHF
ncbi:phosphate propanoyltransferase [Clostridium aminobutyricum]|uniref:Phosphate propanoyltransferase n=1 Tax=Clostridium aminobutyricum TaxID=33953 RepID=A0A939DA14_CLOAM|nr:phosphate propanoyltransferase [Clostridium aminobutyricum]MBN7773812.1 phosphate propanoyltransferase [Clostridium aminobutyricum]